MPRPSIAQEPDEAPTAPIAPEITAAELRTSLEGPLKFIERRHRGSGAKAERTRAMEVIEVLQRHLLDLGVEPSLTRSLEDVRMAFVEVQYRRSAPLFEPEPSRGRPSAKLGMLFVMAKAALAIDLLMAAKKTREAATHLVVRKLRDYGVKIQSAAQISKGTPEWKTVIGWREDLAKAGRRAGHHNLDWDWFGKFYLFEKEELLRLVNEENANPESLANRQLEAIPRSLPSVG